MPGNCQLDHCEQLQLNVISFTKIRLKISSAKWRPFCPGGDELLEMLLVVYDAAVMNMDNDQIQFAMHATAPANPHRYSQKPITWYGS